MANLLNVSPQVSNKTAPSLENQNPAKVQGSELKKMFDQQLGQEMASDEAAQDQTGQLLADLGKKMEKEQDEMALANGAVIAPKATVLDLPKNLQTPAADQKTANATELKGLAVQNQLKVGKGIQQPSQVELASAQVGEDLSKLQGEFDVESVDLKNVEEKAAPSKGASSKLSTSDFLNLREISQNVSKSNVAKSAATDPLKMAPIPNALATGGVVLGMKATQKDEKSAGKKDELNATMAGLAPAHDPKQAFANTLDATVSQVHGQKPVLNPESIQNIGNQVTMLGQAKQDGEIKIRLRPDHLGELQMSVRTQGQNVSVQIKAESNEAKKIIEDSLSSLREHLSSQNLSLARIDVVTQPAASSTMDQTQMQFDGNQNFNSFAQSERQQGQDGSQHSGRDFYRDDVSVAAAPTRMVRPRATDSSRLDLIA